MGLDRHSLRVLSLYRGEPAAVRAHNFIRMASCPFGAVHELVPENGQIVDVGCGRGLLASYLALRAPGRTIRGIDPDAAKVETASRCGLPGRTGFSVGDAASGLPGGVDAVTVVDVLYLLPPAVQDDLLTRAAAALRPGGRLVVKEMATEARLRMRLNQVQETLAVKILGWTKGSEAFYFRSTQELAAVMERAGLRTQVRRLDALAVHPHAVAVGRKGEG